MADARIQYIQQKLEQGLEGWDYTPSVETLLSGTRGRQVTDEFFKSDGPPKLLFFCQEATGSSKAKLQFSTGREEALTGKCMFFTRINPKGVDQKSVEMDILYGEIMGSALNSFQLVIDECLKPALEAQENWGKCKEESVTHFLSYMGKFTDLLTEAVHSLSGGIELQMPDEKYDRIQPTQSAFAKAAVDSEVVSHFENIVEKWSSQTEVLLEEKQAAPKDADDSGPDTEFEYWRTRMAKFNNVAEQLKKPQARVVIAVLTTSKSKVLRRWKNCDNGITDALNEAKDNVKYLSTLEKYTEPLYSGTPESIIDGLPALMNNVKMMLTIARYYSTQEHMTTLFVKITNQMIKTCKRSIEAPGGTKVKLWEQNIEDLLKRLEMSLKLNDAYQELYRVTKEKLQTQPKVKQFDFNESQIFGKFDLYCKRVQKLMDMFTTILQFSALANNKVEGMEPLINQFFSLVDDFKKKPYDLLDYTKNTFDRDFLEYNVNIAELETMLQGFINASFENITSTEHALTLLKQFETILQRETLKSDLDSKYTVIFHNYGLDLETVQKIYDKQKNSPPTVRNSPPVAGNLIWARQLLRRIEDPMKKFQANKNIMTTKESKKIIKTYNKVARALIEYETLWHHAWCKSIEAAKAGLQSSLIVRHPKSGRLFVNFDREILQLIRETKCMQRIGIEVPESAKMVLLQEEKFKSYFNQLLFVLKEYDRVLGRVIPVIRPLLKPHLDDLDKKIQPGMLMLTWQSMNIDGYLHRMHTWLSKFEELVNKINDLIENRVESNLKAISKTLLVDIQSDSTFTLEQFVTMQEKVTKRKTLMMDAKNLEVERAVEDLINVVLSFPMEDFGSASISEETVQKLRDHYSRLMYLAILNTTKNSFHTLKKRLTARTSSGGVVTADKPFFDVNVELSLPNVTMNPSLEEIQAAINRCAINVLRCSKRICQWGQDREQDISRLQTFHSLIAQDREIVKVVLLLTGSVEGTKKQVHDYLLTFMAYEHLWKMDKQAEYKKFMATEPDLEAFDNELKKYVEMEANIQAIPAVHNIGCMCLETTPVKASLRAEAIAWKSQYSKNLHSQARDEMHSLQDMMKDTLQKLDRPLNDLDDVRDVMAVLKLIREKESQIDYMLVPIEEKYHLLAKNGVHVDKEEFDDLNHLRESWKKVRSQAMVVSDKLGNLQAGFKSTLTDNVKVFVKDASEFREDFIANGPMVQGVPPMDAAERLTKYRRLFEERQRKWDSYCEGEDLFGLPITQYPELEACKKELELLDKLYGLYVNVVQTIKGYGDMMWTDVVAQIETMTETATGFQALCKRMPKQLRDWEAYGELKKTIDEFFEVLPLLQQCSQKSMRPRHWEAIMQVTGKKIPMEESGPSAESCKLMHVLDLGMVGFAEDVEDIAGGSAKELGIETKLNQIIETWQELAFSFSNFKNRGPVILAAKELGESMEALEDSQMQLGSMAGNRYSAPFRGTVQEWIVNLSTVSDMVEQWISVQNLWIYMEAVFSSGDIAKQLPQEAKRFSGIDKNFMKITQKAFETPNCVQCCCGNDMMKTLLPHLTEQLELCQKSLTGYLETKRNAFPRFYFCSDGVLLEILSQGSDPHAIVQHLQNVFDSLAAVTFDKQKKYLAVTMVANDKEEVPFSNPMNLGGNVEDYLGEIVTQMQETLHDICRDCGAECDTMSCEDNVARFPAQVGILCIQFAWTNDLEDALRRARQDKASMSASNKKALAVLNELIGMTVLDKWDKLQRTNIETLITIQVHQKDVTEELVKKKVKDPGDFEWLKQARLYWRTERDTTVISICDVDFDYQHEYLGCKERLVVTPLTDRCYVTLSQAIGMFLGGAPAGPAGTGKTETTKDMGRMLGIFVVVFNCSDQMDYKSLGKIYKGLAMAGCWGCFDEFNRIDLDVLSVAASQVSCVLAAQRERRDTFIFTDGQEVNLRPGCSYFITMNPGYAGRQELPENLKALFRGVCMMVPDFMLIMRVKLAGCGYYENQVIAKKFDLLYNLCKQQLSKQTHYDYGLRNILSVLRTAGKSKRADLGAPELLLMMRTLRDMNMSKMIAEDVPLFLSLIADLFPGIQAEKAVFKDIEKAAENVSKERNLQWEEAKEWAGKVVQLLETYYVRHGIGVVGPTGAGKTMAIEVLAGALSITDEKHTILKMNPKAVTAPQMFGRLDPTTGDWTDGIFAVLWRKGTKAKNSKTWILLDGPVDAIWIENLNTVLDDNKLLTLANGDRIPMTPEMKAVFEPENLMNASPATVSRMGIIFISESILGWSPLGVSWLTERREKDRDVLKTLIDKYCQELLDVVSRSCKAVMYSTDGIYVNGAFKIFEELLSPMVEAKQFLEEAHMEKFFIFALCWSIGALLELEDRVKFNDKLVSIGANLPPLNGDTCFEYFVDQQGEWQHWKTRVQEWQYPTDKEPKFAELLIPTLDSLRYESMLSMLVPQGKPVLFTGGPGVSKTADILMYLQGLDQDAFNLKMTPFSFVTTTMIYQRTLESTVEKRQGRTYGPPGGKKCVFFIDDISMPVINSWGDQITNEIVRQSIAEAGVYNLDKPGEWKGFVDICYTAAMTHPGGGRNDIPNRLKRQYNLFNVTMPSLVAVDNIFGSIIRGRLSPKSVSPIVADVAVKLTDATIQLWQKTSAKMLPTPAKFHYLFNMRELSRVFAGLFEAPRDTIKDDVYLVKLWRHECERVFTDKLTNQPDKDWESHAILDVIGEVFGQDMVNKVNGMCYFVNFLGDPIIDADGVVEEQRPKLYEEVLDTDLVRKKAFEFQKMHNEENKVGKLELVLFEYALEHLMRINRVINMDRGSMMLVGVGGSGKQSLTRLSAFIAGHFVFQITITKHYNVNNLFDDLKLLYKTAGLQGRPVAFIFTDAEVKEEGFLEYINQILSTGEVSGLFAKDEVDAIIGDIRPVAKKEYKGFVDTADNLWKYFQDRSRNNLHLVLCMSPVGDLLSSRCRKFPALINCTTVDWFLSWPEEGLRNVAESFIADFEMAASPEIKSGVIAHMGNVHTLVRDATLEYFDKFRRNVYVTPKSYLSFIKSYTTVYTREHAKVKVLADKINNGLEKLFQAQDDVGKMKVELAASEIVLAEAVKKSAELLKEISVATAAAEKVKASAKVIADAANEKATTIGAEKAEVEKDLEAAKPALLEAEDALKAIKPDDIKNLKALKNPPVVIKIIFDGVLLLRRKPLPKCQMVEEKGTLCYKDNYAESTKMMAESTFLTDLQGFPKEAITDEDCELLEPYITHTLFTVEAAAKASGLAVGLCKWVKAMSTYHMIAKVVIPKMDALRLKEAELASAMKKLAAAEAELNAAQAELDAMQAKFDAAMAEKQRLQDETDATKRKMDAASQLINGLAGERDRWTQQSADFADQIARLAGDCAIACGFMSYTGPFNKSFRDMLLTQWFLNDLVNKKIPVTKNLNVSAMLADEATTGQWNLQGLPTDDLSIQNGILTTSASRFPIMIDPQGQGLSWVKQMEAENDCKETGFNDKAFRQYLEDCMGFGRPLLLANVENELDPVLDPVLDKAFQRKGKGFIVALADKECDVEPEKFKLYITTRLPNPHFTPELSAKVTIIDFTVTMKGLEDQLLDRVVQHEKPELQTERTKLKTEVNDYTAKILELQDDLLFRLANCTGSLLDDPDIIDVLNVTKKTSAEVQEKLKNAGEAELRIKTACEEYRPVATRGSIIYFLIAEMSAVNPMYQTSLAQFVQVFQLAMDTAEKAAIPAKRITNVIEEMTFKTFLYVCRGYMEIHKKIYTLLLALKLQLQSEIITMDHFSCFTKGGAALDINAVKKKPKEWVPDSVWLNIIQLSMSIPLFKELPDIVARNESLWRQWYDQEAPEAVPVPDIDDRLDKMHKMLLVRSVRTDRTMIAADEYIQEALEPKYTDTFPLNLEQTHQDVCDLVEAPERVPFIFVLTPGSDPTELVTQLAKKRKKEVLSVSMGQGQEIVARRYISTSVASGGWVLLQNTHLGIKYLIELEQNMVKMEDIHSEFRVWITAEAHPGIPIGLLQMSIKITNEAPVGMRAGMKRSYAWVTQDMIDTVPRVEWRTLLWVLCHLHSVTQERRKFGAIGWTVPYEFNQSDLNACALFLQNHILDMDAKKAKDVTWSTVRYMISEIQYGGRITDDWDRRQMATFAEKFFCQAVLEPGYSFLKGYTIPQGTEIAHFRDHVNTYPATDVPEVVGLNMNADLVFRLDNAEKVFNCIIDTQPKGGGGGKGASREEIVTELCKDLLSKLPPNFKKEEIKAYLTKAGATKPINISFRQELDVIAKIMSKVRSTLQDLQLAIDGTIVMSDDLSNALDALANAKVPPIWLKGAWFSPTVGIWYQSLLGRCEQWDRWIKSGRPKSYWLPGFTNGQGFLTAVRQEVTRSHSGWALDDVAVFTEVTKHEFDDVKEGPNEGVYVHGLYLDGCGWSKKESKLVEAPPKVLFIPLPCMWISAVQRAQKKLDYMVYECPVYERKDPRKRGMTAAQPNFVFAPEIRTEDPPAKWILRGVALLQYPGE
jgi:dynein heavy chain